jgi:hypothetical protein
VRLEALGQLKNLITSSGIEHVTIWLVEGEESSLPHVVQIDSGARPARWVKQRIRKGDHPPQTSAELKKMWIYTSTPPYISMA